MPVGVAWKMVEHQGPMDMGNGVIKRPPIRTIRNMDQRQFLLSLVQSRFTIADGEFSASAGSATFAIERSKLTVPRTLPTLIHNPSITDSDNQPHPALPVCI